MWYYRNGDVMKTIGLICEYNPFHNGHLYHINKTKEMFPNSTLILVLSGNVTMRGELSVLNKWDKTEIALNHGIDLVVEIPFTHASQAADVFCYASVKLLSILNVDTIVFGSESDSIDNLKRCADIQLNNNKYEKLVSKYLSEGNNYPTSLSKALKDISGIDINTPNDILGLGYVKEIIKNSYNIEPITIKRTNDYHDEELTGSISSATSIRRALINNQPIKGTVPDTVLPLLTKNVFFLRDYYQYLKYKLISESDLTIYQTVDKDIISRINKYIEVSNTFDEFIDNIKTKYYTYNRLMRMCSHILFSYTKEEASTYSEISYIRVLGFTDTGKKHLNSIKKDLELPIITNYSNDKHGLLDIEMRVAKILGLLQGEEFVRQEYQNKPIHKKT